MLPKRFEQIGGVDGGRLLAALQGKSQEDEDEGEDDAEAKGSSSSSEAKSSSSSSGRRSPTVLRHFQEASKATVHLDELDMHSITNPFALTEDDLDVYLLPRGCMLAGLHRPVANEHWEGAGDGGWHQIPPEAVERHLHCIQPNDELLLRAGKHRGALSKAKHVAKRAGGADMVVTVRCLILNISDVHTATESFQAKFILKLSWRAPYLIGIDFHDIDWNVVPSPEVYVSNALGFSAQNDFGDEMCTQWKAERTPAEASWRLPRLSCVSNLRIP